VLPVAIVVLPVILTLGLVVAVATGDVGAVERAVVTLLGSVAGGVGLTMLFEQLGRDQGKKKEDRLWASWGGSPTLQMLRHRDAIMCKSVTRERYHRKLKKLVRDVVLPSGTEEAADPVEADRRYDACIRFLRNATRDRSRFPLIFAENVNYGFRRNLWGMRAAGTACATLGALSAGYITALALAAGDEFWVAGLIIVLVDAVLLTWWIVRIRSKWVLTAAKAYAERLLEACDSLGEPTVRGGVGWK
jgi:hypothetical protein